MAVLFIFIDGLGLGENDAEKNPFARFPTPFFSQQGRCLFTKEAVGTSADMCFLSAVACLGVLGLPQSGSGHAAIFSGRNVPMIWGRHIPGFPGPSLSKLLNESNVVKDLAQHGYKVTSANMYVPNYFELVAKRKRKNSVTTLVILSAGTTLRSKNEMLAEKAVYQDITNEMLPMVGVDDIPVISPALAAKRLLTIAESHHFTLFEYFQTDRCGHKRNWAWAEKIICELDEFLMAIYKGRSDDLTVVLTSDHGNFEDFSTKTHTRNLVPVILMGANIETIDINDITQITPAITSLIRERIDDERLRYLHPQAAGKLSLPLLKAEQMRFI